MAIQRMVPFFPQLQTDPLETTHQPFQPFIADDFSVPSVCYFWCTESKSSDKCYPDCWVIHQEEWIRWVNDISYKNAPLHCGGPHHSESNHLQIGPFGLLIYLTKTNHWKMVTFQSYASEGRNKIVMTPIWEGSLAASDVVIRCLTRS